ncbi:GntR family transcriptional regulator [Clostridium sp. LIBA-8841]|uniref:GntR family transcriptional regulator n=1 Tax=Clostridium sp. LIBA-8841 TaxID=2987530 RepID=UPI002AC79137|nr:GntR family transcriptional regulator [Clostridium sp. LIBA-8841]MDZ5254913.1 GntR family transcriptional regulator [Clostridium sp. LIBA-8841]
MIDKNSPIPVYYQLKEMIKEKITKGTWKVGQCIASERELTEAYGVSRMTVRQALGELVQEGLLVREKGKGTFVCEPKVKQEDMMSFSDIIKKAGRSLITRVLAFEVINTPDELADTFNVDKIYKINRLRLVDGEAVANEVVYIPCEYCGFVTKEDLEGSLFKLLEEKGYVIESTESALASVIMDEELKNLFNVDKQVPLLKSHNAALNSEGEIIYVEDAIYRSDKYVLEINISKREGKLK